MRFDKRFEVLIKVAQIGSFTGAANELGISGAAVSKQIKFLEDRLGIVLFNRTTRVVTLTEAGKKLFDTVNKAGDEISEVLDTLAEGLEKPSGVLKINAPMAFGERFLVAPITEYSLTYPEVILDIEFNDRRVNLVEEGYDLVIRIGKLEDSGLIAKKLCDFETSICASPSFIKKYGLPKTPNDLQKIPLIHYKNSSTGLSYHFRDPKGVSESIELEPVIHTNSLEMLIQSTLEGIGFSNIPTHFCHNYIHDGRLIKLLSEYKALPERGIYAVYPDRRFLPMKVRLFIDFLKKSLINSNP
jgi:DNA-binding transcriptional LysR family regulator